MRRSACGCMVKWMNLQNGSRATSSCGYFCRIFSPLAVAVRYAAQFSEFLTLGFIYKHPSRFAGNPFLTKKQ